MGSRTLSNGANINNYFQDFSRVVHTKGFPDTDQYGKPGMTFLHEGDIAGMATDLKKMLSEDFANRYIQNESQTRKSTHELDRKENPISLYDLFSNEDFKETKINREEQQSSKSQKPLNVEQQPLMSLYDLFCFSEEERKQTNLKKRGKSQKKASTPYQFDLFSQPQNSTGQIPPPAPMPIKEKPVELPVEPRPFASAVQEFHKQGSLVIDNGQVGFLKERYRDDAVFMPLELNPIQKQRAEQYIKFRDTYHLLYNYEATERTENSELRQSFNTLYDDFVRQYGHLNDRKNLDLIKMDAGGQEILSLERFIDGKLVKADIFTQPVSFNPNEIKQVDTPVEALSASLNKFGEVNLDYMYSLLDDKNAEEILHDLNGRIYYNPLISNYEVSDKFIAGNVIAKAEILELYLKENPQSEYQLETAASLKALQDARPRPITFEELDFNFGERWIPQNIYSEYASYLFDGNYSASNLRLNFEYSIFFEKIICFKY